MSEIRIQPRKLGAALTQKGQDLLEAQHRACYSAAMRLKERLVRVTDEMGITDRGVYKASFYVLKTQDGAVTGNEAPHAGIVECGARPHHPGREGVEALIAWAKRKLQLDDKEAHAAGWAIAMSILQKGIKGRFVMRDNQSWAKWFFEMELEREAKS